MGAGGEAREVGGEVRCDFWNFSSKKLISSFLYGGRVAKFFPRTKDGFVLGHSNKSLRKVWAGKSKNIVFLRISVCAGGIGSRG